MIGLALMAQKHTVGSPLSCADDRQPNFQKPIPEERAREPASQLLIK